MAKKKKKTLRELQEELQKKNPALEAGKRKAFLMLQQYKSAVVKNKKKHLEKKLSRKNKIKSY